MDKEHAQYTIEDILALPEGERAELINGQMFMMASPTAIHQSIIGWLHVKMYSHIEQNKGKCRVFLSPFAVFLKNDNKNYVEPDIFLIRNKEKLDNEGYYGAPDWIIEVISPSSKSMDYYRKTSAYSEAGVREYWIIDPLKEIVIAYDFEHEDAPQLYHFTDKIKANVLEGLTIDFAELKENLKNMQLHKL